MSQNGERLLVNFQPYKISVNIDRTHIDITVSDTIYAGLVETIAKLMLGPISDGIEAAVKMELDKNIHKILDKRIESRDGYRMPLKSVDVFNQLKIDMSVPSVWKIKETGLEASVSGYSFNVNDGEPTLAVLGDQQVPALIPYDPTNKDDIQVYFGNWFANNFLKAFFKQNPGIGFKLDESTIHSAFDIATLNYILPGLYQYYGLVNKDCYCWIEFLEAGDFTIYPGEDKVNVKGRLKAHVYVVGGNLDGSNQLFLTLNGDEA